VGRPQLQRISITHSTSRQLSGEVVDPSALPLIKALIAAAVSIDHHPLERQRIGTCKADRLSLWLPLRSEMNSNERMKTPREEEMEEKKESRRPGWTPSTS